MAMVLILGPENGAYVTLPLSEPTSADTDPL